MWCRISSYLQLYLLKEMRKKGQKNLVIDCGMNSEYFKFIYCSSRSSVSRPKYKTNPLGGHDRTYILLWCWEAEVWRWNEFRLTWTTQKHSQASQGCIGRLHLKKKMWKKNLKSYTNEKTRRLSSQTLHSSKDRTEACVVKWRCEGTWFDMNRCTHIVCLWVYLWIRPL